MDVYHKVLQQLNEATGGKDSKTVDFKDLVKRLGFYGNYTDIFERLNREGWIAESSKEDYVSITHWGVAEVRKSASGGNDEGGDNAAAERSAAKAAAAARELARRLEDFAQDAESENFPAIEKSFSDLQNLIAEIKQNLK